MKEVTQLSILIVISMVIAAIAVESTNYFEYGGNLIVKEYKADFYPHGHLHESYKYDVKGQYTMLYRVWNVPLVYNNSHFEPYVELISINCSCISYVKEWDGDVYISDTNYSYDVYEKAYYNE
ncbi:MAG: hypothetical protein J7K47_02525, partial [Thermoplasmata archaeon]|nr:hypothetical protein [Thermoplasmata archaeon]